LDRAQLRLCQTANSLAGSFSAKHPAFLPREKTLFSPFSKKKMVEKEFVFYDTFPQLTNTED
jgi:hypothetical protein